jgi:hypothetical protein
MSSRDPELLQRFLDEAYLWRLGQARGPRRLANAAAELLADGLDTAALRELAGLPAASDHWEVLPLVESTVKDLSGTPLPTSPIDLQFRALRAMCRDHLAGTVGGRALTAWTHAVIGHLAFLEAEELTILDDDYDYAEHVRSENDLREIDDRVRTAALSVVDSIAASGTPLPSKPDTRLPFGQRLRRRLRRRPVEPDVQDA